ncbi:hypothetical protein TgHK011_005757 [Trichoderma gracile]|nr:hypothetical protein TgHK011_005757 [Trichoderma gracile]
MGNIPASESQQDAVMHPAIPAKEAGFLLLLLLQDLNRLLPLSSREKRRQTVATWKGTTPCRMNNTLRSSMRNIMLLLTKHCFRKPNLSRHQK